MILILGYKRKWKIEDNMRECVLARVKVSAHELFNDSTHVMPCKIVGFQSCTCAFFFPSNCLKIAMHGLREVFIGTRLRDIQMATWLYFIMILKH